MALDSDIEEIEANDDKNGKIDGATKLGVRYFPIGR
jgi:hypothetical protein